MPQASRPLRLRDWIDIDWHQSKKAVKDLRGQIFRATKDRDHRKLRSLQRLMLRSRANAEVSVRQVTQINKGKNTPGVDGRVATTPDERTQIIKELLQNDEKEIHPVKRVYIPKSNGKVRPLGIPTIVTRARQAMVKNALEPQWEAKFEPCSYGFRPGRSCHDAIGRIFRTALPQGKKKWILDADIKGAFDNIGHTALMKNLENFPAKDEIRKWLKAGVMENGIFSKTDQGTPQGGVISPLLANIALHGMEQALGVTYYSRKEGYTKCSSKRLIIRYADDFVVFTENREDAELCQDILTDWLRDRGLELSTEKTRILSLREGFDFLGFHIKEYTERQTPKPILLIKPSRDSVNSFNNRIRQEFNDLKGHNVDALLKKLNPILRGWGYYFRHVASGETFSKLDGFMWLRTMKWTKLTHPKKTGKWRLHQYFGFTKDKISKWIFGNPDTGQYLLRLGMHIPIRRHILVKHGASPDNPEERAYWTKREKRKVELFSNIYKGLAKKQKGLCPICWHTLYGEEKLHIHHKIPKRDGGSDSWNNLQLLHGVCHRQEHNSGNSSQKQTA